MQHNSVAWSLTVEDEFGEVFDLKEICADMDLDSLVDLVKDRLGLTDFTSERFGEEVCLWHLERSFNATEMSMSLVDIGIQDGMRLSCKSPPPPMPISVVVSDMSGSTVQLGNFECDVTIETLIAKVEAAFQCSGDESCQVIWGTQHLGQTDRARTLKSLGFEVQTQLMCVRTLEAKCPTCRATSGKLEPVNQVPRRHQPQRATVLRDVNIGAVHEGWGRKWNACMYSCMHCQLALNSHEKVNACNACRCFWHRSCKTARAQRGRL